jgi:hypothetical protein
MNVLYGIDFPYFLIVMIPVSFCSILFMIMTVFKDAGVIPQNIKKIKRLEYLPVDTYIQNKVVYK